MFGGVLVSLVCLVYESNILYEWEWVFSKCWPFQKNEK
jgi:hypothetical protein